jgi:hypothetical protein
MSENKLFCDVCIGKKYVIGMGMMQVNCPKCKGLGYVDGTVIKVEEQNIDVFSDSDNSEKIDFGTINKDDEFALSDEPIKKKGRPKKNG